MFRLIKLRQLRAEHAEEVVRPAEGGAHQTLHAFELIEVREGRQ